jgi:hypothetical protein
MQAVLSKMTKGISVCYSEVFPNANDDYSTFKLMKEKVNEILS